MIDPDLLDRITGDPFMDLLGATFEELEPGYCRASLTVSPQMLNFHRITHGGVIFGLGDIAFAAACNARGQKAVALNICINFLRPTGVGDTLVAEAREIETAGATALYTITVTEQKSSQLVASFQALAYRKTA
jgi:acyl-CoA thioesterase